MGSIPTPGICPLLGTTSDIVYPRALSDALSVTGNTLKEGEMKKSSHYSKVLKEQARERKSFFNEEPERIWNPFSDQVGRIIDKAVNGRLSGRKIA